MKTTRTLLLVLIAAISLAGLTNMVQAQDTATNPAAPAIDEGDKVGGDGAKTGGATISASDAPPTTQPAGTKKGPRSFFEDPTMLLLIGAMLLMFIFMGKGKRKTEKKRKEMLATLKKNDKVTTIGGIIGTVMEVRDDEVTIKIDESSNARMRFARWAVRGVGSDAKSETPEDKK